MKLEDAIKHQERRIASPFVRAHPDSKNATQLGIEAMKLLKQHPTIRAFLPDRLLPGETE